MTELVVHFAIIFATFFYGMYNKPATFISFKPSIHAHRTRGGKAWKKDYKIYCHNCLDILTQTRSLCYANCLTTYRPWNRR